MEATLLSPRPASFRRSLAHIRFRRSSSSTSPSFHIYSIHIFHHNHKRSHLLHKTRKKFTTSPLSSSSTSPPAPPPPPPPLPPPSPPPPQQGAKPIPLTISLAVGAILYFLIPRPSELSPQAWQLLSIFLSTIAGLVLSPLPSARGSSSASPRPSSPAPSRPRGLLRLHERGNLADNHLILLRPCIREDRPRRQHRHVLRQVAREEHPRPLIRTDSERGLDRSSNAKHHRPSRRGLPTHHPVVIPLGRKLPWRAFHEETRLLSSPHAVSGIW